MKAVLDTAVIVAAVRSDAGASRQLLMDALNRRFELLLSVPLVLEYEAVMKRKEQLAASGMTNDSVDEIVNAPIAVAIPVHRVSARRPATRDTDDEMVLETALAGQAAMLVTFNVRDFRTAATMLEVLTPGQALRKIRRRNEEE